MFKRITFTLILICIFSCKKSNEKEIIKASTWLLGNWETTTPEGKLVENWTKLNDSTFTGSSYFIKGKDTIHKEKIILQELEESLIYNTTITGQNNNQSMLYTQTESSENELIFENPNTDYPKKIIYSLTNPNILNLNISGKQSSNLVSESYTLKK